MAWDILLLDKTKRRFAKDRADIELNGCVKLKRGFQGLRNAIDYAIQTFEARRLEQ